MKRILLVEDTNDLAELLRRELRLQGYLVDVAPDGRAALASFKQNPPDLLILDWLLPELDGLEVLRQVRAVAQLPVLMLTARSAESDRVIGLELGADDYLVKPFGMRELVARVRALLRRQERLEAALAADRQSTQDALTMGSITLDPLALQASVEGQALELSHTEFVLLELLLRSPGRVFSRTYLQETLHDQVPILGERSIDNLALRLRKKLGAAGSQIETVWGVGYRFKKTA